MIAEARDVTATTAIVDWSYGGVSSFTVLLTSPGTSRTLTTTEKTIMFTGTVHYLSDSALSLVHNKL